MVHACLLLVEALSAETEHPDKRPEQNPLPHPFSQRPPVVPITLGVLAQGKGKDIAGEP